MRPCDFVSEQRKKNVIGILFGPKLVLKIFILVSRRNLSEQVNIDGS